jgi:hypothetical protein
MSARALAVARPTMLKVVRIAVATVLASLFTYCFPGF